MVSIEGEGLRGVTWCVVEEVERGDWGIGGNAPTTADVHALAHDCVTARPRARRVAPEPSTLVRGAPNVSASYILMITAFYVDNGPNLPLWRELPPFAFWILPTLVGTPILLNALLRHPLARSA